VAQPCQLRYALDTAVATCHIVDAMPIIDPMPYSICDAGGSIGNALQVKADAMHASDAAFPLMQPLVEPHFCQCKQRRMHLLLHSNASRANHACQ
jgi:hypothetical protein